LAHFSASLSSSASHLSLAILVAGGNPFILPLATNERKRLCAASTDSRWAAVMPDSAARPVSSSQRLFKYVADAAIEANGTTSERNAQAIFERDLWLGRTSMSSLAAAHFVYVAAAMVNPLVSLAASTEEEDSLDSYTSTGEHELAPVVETSSRQVEGNRRRKKKRNRHYGRMPSAFGKQSETGKPRRRCGKSSDCGHFTQLCFMGVCVTKVSDGG